MIASIALLALSLGAAAHPQAAHQESRSSVVAGYLSLELAPQSECARALRSTKIALPLEGGDGQIEQTYTDSCRGGPATMKLSLKLQRDGDGYRLLITEPGGKPIPVTLALGRHLSVRLDQGEFDLSLTQHGS